MFKKVLVANRGAIACRINKTLKKLQIASVAVYSEPDLGTRHTIEADEAYYIDSTNPSESYLNIEKIMQIAHQCKAEAIHPGYGFLSENAEFAVRCKQEGIVFIGPTADNITCFGLKHEAIKVAQQSGITCLPTSALLETSAEALQAAEIIGYPVILKSSAGGGGIGMQVCTNPATLSNVFNEVKKQAKTFFKCSDVFLEKYIEEGRHIEIQIFGDGKGNIVVLGERECSIQRRRQKIIEESPSPFVTPELREILFSAAKQLTQRIQYESAGTVEFLIDIKTKIPYFLEVNTRLQVEHGVTELVTGIDLVEWMIRQAAGENLHLAEYSVKPQGHAIQARIYAEIPNKDFQPNVGQLTEVIFPQEIRVDTWVELGQEISAFYDSLLAKLIVHEPTRDQAIQKMLIALEHSKLSGVQTNLNYLKEIFQADAFKKGQISTTFLEQFNFTAPLIEVLESGTYTTVQDYPGRLRYWSVGIPPSGPMDSFAFRIANRLVENEEGMACLEITLRGPTLKFYSDTVIAITGAPLNAKIDGIPIQLWRALSIKKGSILTLEESTLPGCRSYLAVKNGIDVPLYLNSRSTFVPGKFGGHQGRTLLSGDFLPILSSKISLDEIEYLSVMPNDFIPKYSTEWEIGVMIGPHASPDFFTQASLDNFLQAQWKVHYNSNRLGVRLIGPKPEWSRKDGGEAGLHPSNLHDYIYAVGSINYSGDMPIILTCDGPSLGGFVCPVTIVSAELWKVGQLKPGDTIKFILVNRSWALEQKKIQNEWIKTLGKSQPLQKLVPTAHDYSAAILHQTASTSEQPQVIYRQAGDSHILIEYGPPILDLAFRFRVFALISYLEEQAITGIIEISPGIRSLQIHFDNQILSCEQLMQLLLHAESQLLNIDELEIPTRILELPLAFAENSVQDAIHRYMQSVRKNAPYLPCNMEFVRRINGLASIAEVKKIIYTASYMILGLGDVFLGAPCAVPVDPRHRLVTSKYNPARTYTPEGAVGLGGVYMCMYGIDSPGGYQLVGRTIPFWNTFIKNSNFQEGQPWLFRCFDQIRFYEVSEEQLQKQRKDFARNLFHVNIKTEIFRVKDYCDFLNSIQNELQDFQQKQKISFEKERTYWENEATQTNDDNVNIIPEKEKAFYCNELSLPENTHTITASISGNIWSVLVEVGMWVKKGTQLAILEAMKMEFAIYAKEDGIVRAIYCEKGKPVQQGELLFSLEKHNTELVNQHSDKLEEEILQ